MSLPELSWYLGTTFIEELLRDYNLDADDAERINAVCEAWGEEDVTGTMATARDDLRRRVMAVLP